MTYYSHLHQVRKAHSAKELRQIHQSMLEAIDRLKTCESDVIHRLQEVERLLVHRFLGYGSLFRYATAALALSDHQAYAFVSVAKKARELPLIQEAVRSGELTVSKASRIVSVINSENQSHWVDMAKSKTKREIEKAVAAASPRTATPERTRYLNATLCQLQLPMTEENLAKIERAREVLAQSQGRPLSLEETLVTLADLFLERKDPVRKAERVLARASKRSSAAPSDDNEGATGANSPETFCPGRKGPSVSSGVDVAGRSKGASDKESNRMRIPTGTRHLVMLRDRGQCQARAFDGTSCGERIWVELHHLEPRSRGGTNDLANLATLCRHHHQLWHAGGEIRT